MDGEGKSCAIESPSIDNDSCNQVTVEEKGKDDALQDVQGNVEDAAVKTDSFGASDEIRERGQKTEEEMRECKYCEFKADDWPAFVQHVFKSHHIKKVAEAYKLKLPKETPQSLSCDICSVTCFGHQSFNSHLLGAKHQKAMQQKAVKNERGSLMKNTHVGHVQNKKPYDKPQKSAKGRAIGAKVFASYPQPLIGLEYVTEVQVAGKIPRYECSLCDAKFEHDLKFPHLVGQKHRMNVLKIKRPDFVRELHPTSKKRSELTAALLKESIDLELSEGRKEVKIRVEKPSSLMKSSLTEGRGGSRGRGRGGKVGFSARGSWSNRGTSYTRGGRPDMELYGPPQSSGLMSSYDSYGNGEYDSFRDDQFSYEMPYNASFEISNYSINYQQSPSLGQGYLENDPSYFGREYSRPPPQVEPPQIKSTVSSGLANAIGNLTKIVKNDEDASVALQVSNALTQALLQYRMDDKKPDFH